MTTTENSENTEMGYRLEDAAAFLLAEDSGDEETFKIIQAAIEVHRTLGAGLLESAYEECLCFELRQRGLEFERQKPIPVVYKGVQLEAGFRADVIVNNSVLIEIKSVESLLPIHQAQILSYLKLAKLSTGLLINFNVPLLKKGLRRFVL